MKELSPNARVEYLLGALAALATEEYVRRTSDALVKLITEHFSDRDEHLEVLGLIYQAANDPELRRQLMLTAVVKFTTFPEVEGDWLPVDEESAVYPTYIDRVVFDKTPEGD